VTKTGRVREVSGLLVIIGLDRAGACGGCGYGEPPGGGPRLGGCSIFAEEERSGDKGRVLRERSSRPLSGTSTKPMDLPPGPPSADRACPSNPGLLAALNRNNLPLTPGQRVAVEFPPGSVLAQTLTALLLPFLGLIAGYVLGGIWVSPPGNQALRAVAGGAGLFISAGIIYFIRKYLPPLKPTVVYYNEGS
jgi:hypothetical protein